MLHAYNYMEWGCGEYSNKKRSYVSYIVFNCIHHCILLVFLYYVLNHFFGFSNVVLEGRLANSMAMDLPWINNV